MHYVEKKEAKKKNVAIKILVAEMRRKIAFYN